MPRITILGSACGWQRSIPARRSFESSVEPPRPGPSRAINWPPARRPPRRLGVAAGRNARPPTWWQSPRAIARASTACERWPNSKFTAAKSRRQRFASPVDPPTACRWSWLVSPYQRCRPKDGNIDPSDALRMPGDQVRTLFRCRSTVHPEAHTSRSRPIRFTIAANIG